jgi:light-regulated signal transduction histidine kinase (bacteriophytochrome)
MKALFFPLVLPALSAVALAQATAPATEPPVPVTQAWPAAAAQPAAPAEQRLYGANATPLIAPATAQAVVDKFRAAYGTVSAPRLVIYVNRSLVDAAGLKLTGRNESYTEKSADGKTTSTKTKGTGLGLAIVKKIIEEHGGVIWLDTSYNNGAGFIIQLPVFEFGSN